MPNVAPYLNFSGNCEEAFNFYKSAFGGEFMTFVRFSEMPPSPGQPPMPANTANQIAHVALPIGNSLLMGSDNPEGFGPPHQVGNNFSVSIDTSSKEEADKLFKGLSNGGQVNMPMMDAPWGSYFGMWTDKFGVNWMVSYDKNRQQ